MKTDCLLLTADFALTGDEAAPRSISGIAYSGGLIPGWNAVIDLDSTDVADSIPLLMGHDQGAAIGVLDAIEKNGALKVAGHLFSDIDARAEEIGKKSKRGIKYQMSVGLYQAASEEFAAGSTVTVNGREFVGPITVLRRGRVREASVVVLGADPNTNADFFSAASKPRGNQPEPDMADEVLTARVAELEATNAALGEQLTAATAQLGAIRKEAREKQVKALFEATGRAYAEADAEPYLAMADEAFAAVDKDLRAMVKAAPAHLFRETATGALNNGAGKSALEADAKARGWLNS